MSTDQRPQLDQDPRRVHGMKGVMIVFGRELGVRLLTSAFLVSTALFAALALFAPRMAGGEDTATLGYVPATTQVAQSVKAVGKDTVSTTAVPDRAQAADLLEKGDVDAVIVNAPSGNGYQVLVESSLDPQLSSLLQASLQGRAATQIAMDHGATSAELSTAAARDAVSVVTTGTHDTGHLLLALAFGAAIAMVVVLWGTPLATDVMQEKASRVVEILLTSLRAWQLLAGKVLATTVLGLLQLAAVAAATYAGMTMTGSRPDLSSLPLPLVAVGLVCLILGVLLFATLMAGLAARVERQEDLSGVIQPAFMLALLPFVGVLYLGFSAPTSPLLSVASMTPVLNVFALPVRMAVESVPVWQVALSLVVALATVLAGLHLSGRIYRGSILRSGGRVSLKDSLRTS